MLSSSAIPLFRDIAGLYAAAGFRRAPRAAAFDLFALEFESASDTPTRAIGPHRRGFFQLTYRLGDDGGDLLLASSPDQVLNRADYLHAQSGLRDGFTLLFKAGALAHQLASPTNEFPFFCLPASLELPVSAEWRVHLLPQFRALARVADDPVGAYRAQRFSALAAALLYEVRAIYEQAGAAVDAHRLCAQLVCRFDEVVLQHFQTHHTVEDFARLLHVSADHLSAEVKARTGRNAREIIAERLITEAKHLLTHTELAAGEIADRLGFGEATHFARFFKRHVRESPTDFRRRVHGALGVVGRRADAAVAV